MNKKIDRIRKITEQIEQRMEGLSRKEIENDRALMALIKKRNILSAKLDAKQANDWKESSFNEWLNS